MMLLLFSCDKISEYKHPPFVMCFLEAINQKSVLKLTLVVQTLRVFVKRI